MIQREMMILTIPFLLGDAISVYNYHLESLW